MHWNFTDNGQTVSVNLSENSSDGAVWGTVTFGGITFPVSGFWQASNGGGITARRVSNLRLSGQFATEPGKPAYIAVSGLIQGTAPSMGPMDLSFHSAASSDGSMNQLQAHLDTPLQQAAPSNHSPPTQAAPDTGWALCSLDGSIKLRVLVGGSGAVNGILTLGNDFTVRGEWAASGVLGRAASAFEVTGNHEVSAGADDLIAAAGTMTGPAHWPKKVEISGNVASISEYQNTPFQGTLLPMSSDSSADLDAAYAESYMVIEMGGTDGDSQAVAGWIGPKTAQMTQAFGGADYKTVGTALTAEQLASITSGNSPGDDTNHIAVPAFVSAAASRPIMVQFPGPAEHFPQPPLEEYHENITKIFYDASANALVLQFDDHAGGANSGVINFNHGQGHHSGRNHNSVIIEPR